MDRSGAAGGKMVPYHIDHAATAVTIPAKPKNAPLDWRARSSGVGMVKRCAENSDVEIYCLTVKKRLEEFAA
jgi:hypothetical protein